MNHTFNLNESDYAQFTNWSRSKGYFDNYNFTTEASVNTETVWHDGPVVEAMNRGAILLLDEIDLASNKIMCLQSVLEGNGVFLKKVNRHVKPQPGFNIFATANTKGRGSSDGKFIGTNVLNEAFLERFAVTFEWDYPTQQVESKILMKNLQTYGEIANEDSAEQLVTDLTTWAKLIRETYNTGGVEDVISTRRLINIVKAYVIWGKISKAVDLCVARFDEDTSKTFRDFFDKVYRDPRTTIASDPGASGNPAPEVTYSKEFKNSVRRSDLNTAITELRKSSSVPSSTLSRAFDFSISPEGYSYWSKITSLSGLDSLQHNEVLMKLEALQRAVGS